MADTTGWYEFLKPGVRTTHIAYVHEHSPVYLPEGPDVVTQEDFLFASAEGQVTRLVPDGDARKETLEEARSALMDLIQGPPRDEWDAAVGACIAAIEALEAR